MRRMSVSEERRREIERAVEAVEKEEWGETVPEAIKAMNDVKRGIFERCLREGFFIPLPKQWK